MMKCAPQHPCQGKSNNQDEHEKYNLRSNNNNQEEDITAALYRKARATSVVPANFYSDYEAWRNFYEQNSKVRSKSVFIGSLDQAEPAIAFSSDEYFDGASNSPFSANQIQDCEEQTDRDHPHHHAKEQLIEKYAQKSIASTACYAPGKAKPSKVPSSTADKALQPTSLAIQTDIDDHDIVIPIDRLMKSFHSKKVTKFSRAGAYRKDHAYLPTSPSDKLPPEPKYLIRQLR